MNVPDPYRDYDKWERWEDPPDPSSTGERCFAEEMRRANLKSGANLLEFGVGPGAFLDWARQKDFDIKGVELKEVLVAAVRARGHHVLQRDSLAAVEPEEGPFNAVVVFARDRTSDTGTDPGILSNCQRAFKPGGRWWSPVFRTAQAPSAGTTSMGI